MKITTRRATIKSGIAAILLAGPIKQSVARDSEEKHAKKIRINQISFDKNIFLDRVAEGWHIQARLTTYGKYRKRAIHVTMEVATDPHFSQIVHEKDFEIPKNGPYLLKYLYRPEQDLSELFIRLKTNREVGDRRLKSFFQSKTPHIEKTIYSGTSYIAPWNDN